MRIRTLAVFFWLTLIGAAAVAGEEHETHIKIQVDDSGNVFEWRSNDPDMNLGDLEVGESTTLASETGKDITVTRTEEGLVFDVDGKEVKVREFEGDFDFHSDHDVVVNTEKRIKVIKTDDDSAVTIISAEGIDDEKRARIKAALEAEGVDGEVMFLDGSELHEDGQAHVKREVRIIRKDKDEDEDETN